MIAKQCLFILLAVLITSCHEDQVIDLTEYRTNLLINSWIHAYNPDCPPRTKMVFKSDQEPYLTTWRFRNRLDLNGDSTAVYKIATPFDPHMGETSQIIKGTWRYDDVTQILQIIDEDGNVQLSFDVEGISEGRLTMTYGEFHPSPKPK